jgi:LacI family transcriptional regulator
MTLLPERTVAWQIAGRLKAGIAAGLWSGTLPPERALCAQLQAGRSTLGKALAMLREEGLLKSEPRGGHHVAAHEGRHKCKAVFGILTPAPLDSLYENHATHVTTLFDQFSKSGHECRHYHGRHFYQRGAARALGALFENELVAGWIVFLSTPAMQQWLARAPRPAVIVGSACAGIRLPMVDADYRAIGRHAAGVLLKNGHRRIAFIHQRPVRGGDIETVAGFREAIARARHEITAQIVCHDGTAEDASRLVRRLVLRPARTSGMFVSSPDIYATVATTLARCQLRIPEDVSLISRRDNPNLGYLMPAPAHYRVDIGKMARQVHTLALRSINMPCHDTRIRLIADYKEGKSVGPALDG